jgi:hypothetical protein
LVLNFNLGYRHGGDLEVKSCCEQDGSTLEARKRCSNIGILNIDIANCEIRILVSDTDNYLVSGNTYSNCGTDESINS